jgi:hypothetical protein
MKKFFVVLLVVFELLVISATAINVKDFYLGMDIQEARSRALDEVKLHAIPQKNIGPIFQVNGWKMFSIGMYSFIISDELGKVQGIFLHGSVVDLMFNGWSQTPSQFAAAFAKNNNIDPTEANDSGWTYIENASEKLTISATDKALGLVNLKRETEVLNCF